MSSSPDGPSADVRSRLYEAYATTHAGHAESSVTGLTFRRDIAPLLGNRTGLRILDIGCGQGGLVAACLAAGYPQARGVDISPEQVTLARAAGLGDVVALGDFRDTLRTVAGELDVVLAVDVLEHMGREELLETMDAIRAALAPGGSIIARVPNAGSPFGGLIRHGDLTHESWFTTRSVAQLCAASGFAPPRVTELKPRLHGARSALRVAVWFVVSALMKLALAAETGQLRGHVVTQNMTFQAVVRPAGRTSHR